MLVAWTTGVPAGVGLSGAGVSTGVGLAAASAVVSPGPAVGLGVAWARWWWRPGVGAGGGTPVSPAVGWAVGSVSAKTVAVKAKSAPPKLKAMPSSMIRFMFQPLAIDLNCPAARPGKTRRTPLSPSPRQLKQ